jgi:hypothetical protein
VVKLLDAAIGGEPGVTEDSIDQRIAYAKKNNPLQASVRQHEYGYTALVTDANTGKPSWFGGAVWQTPELAMGHAKAFVKGFPYLEQRFAQRFVDKNRDGIADQGVTEGSTPNKGDEVYYRNRLLGWFAGYGNNDKVIVEPNEDEGHDSNNPIYIDKSAVTIKPNQQGVAEGAPIVVALAPIDVRNPKKAPQPYRNQGDIVPDTKPPSTEKRGVKGRPGQRPMPDYTKDVDENQNSDYLDELKCWPGYSRVPGIAAGAPGSCKKKSK